MVNVKWIKGKMDFYIKSKSFRKLKIKFKTTALVWVMPGRMNLTDSKLLHSILHQPHIESLEKFSLKIIKV